MQNDELLRRQLARYSCECLWEPDLDIVDSKHVFIHSIRTVWTFWNMIEVYSA